MEEIGLIDPKIRTLVTLNDLGSYTKTAEALSLTQPAISHHIKLLEQEFGISIFVKGKRKHHAHGERHPGAPGTGCVL